MGHHNPPVPPMGEAALRVLAHLGQVDRGTANELADELGLPLPDVQHALQNLHAKRKYRPKLVYIKSWVRDTTGGKLYPRPQWASGNKADAPKPPALSGAEYMRRKRAEALAQYNSASVFSLGQSISYRQLQRLKAQAKDQHREQAQHHQSTEV